MRIAVVTGSSSGIGRATALELAGRGCSLVLHARSNLDGLHETARELRSQFECRVRCITGDLSSKRVCRNLVEASFAWQGRVDVWVNNAGADVLKPESRDLSFDDRLEQLLQVDLLGTIRLSRLVCQRWSECNSEPNSATWPSLVNIGWDQAETGMEGDPGQLFCTTKAAIHAFTKAIALTFPVQINCVAPGWIQTSWGANDASDYWNRRAQQECLLDRWGNPHDVAAIIGWLTSTQNSFVNAQVINTNGGRRLATTNHPKERN